MTRSEYVEALRRGLGNLPGDEVERSIAFCEELIDDRIEDGMTEEQAIDSMEPPETMVSKIVCETPMPVLIKGGMERKRKVNWGVIALLVLGFPLWFSLLAAVFAIVLAVYVTMWSVVVALAATLLALAISFPAALVYGAAELINGDGLLALAGFGAALVCAGAAGLLFFAVKWSFIGMIKLTALTIKGIKSAFITKR